MKPIRVARDIVPLAKAKAQLSKVVRDVQASRRAIVITQNGTPAAVILSPEEFDRLSGRSSVVRAIEEGIADSDAGRLISDGDLERELDARFGKPPAAPRSSSRKR